MSLYHAYRPQTFAAIVGQDHVKQTLAAAVERDQVAHAYLFSGPRGIGKTSIARILAMAVNCQKSEVSPLRQPATEGQGRQKKTKDDLSSVLRPPSSEPCGSCPSCVAIRSGNDLNVIEIDAASNRGIDEIRALKETIGFAPSTSLGTGPSSSARKVYIIDEVHMLTKEAFNALLKTLEEPPAHAIFILATTELHRVPDTIISRTQHFSFKRATLADTRMHLGAIAAKEGLTLSAEATELMALHADGAFRDALSLLDQLAALGEQTITAEHVRLLLGIAPEAELLTLLTASFEDDAVGVHAVLARCAEQGYDPAALADALMTTVRHVVWAYYGLPSEGSELLADFAAKQATEQSPATLIQTIERLITAKQQLRWSPLPMLPLELALIQKTEDRRQKTEAQQTRHSKTEIPASPAGGRNNTESRIPKSETTTVRHPELDSGSGKESSFLSVVIQSAPDRSQEVEVPPQRDPANGGGISRVAQPDPSTAGSATAASVAQDDTGQKPVTTTHNSQLTTHDSTQSTAAVDLSNLAAVWAKVLSAIRPQNAQLAALLKSSQLLAISDGHCQIEVPFSFYADRLKDRKNAALITEAIEAEVGVTTAVRCVVAGTTQKSEVRSQKSGQLTTHNSQLTRTQDDVTKDVLEVFGVAATAPETVAEEVTSG